ncbi:MAG: hypothetical protein ABIT04_06315, partial [Novosphingobium sp.]
MSMINKQLAIDLIREGVLDVEFYISQVPHLNGYTESEISLHYIETGEQEGLSPSGQFDPHFYLEANPDV